VAATLQHLVKTELDEVEAKNPLARNKRGLDGNAWRPSLDEPPPKAEETNVKKNSSVFLNRTSGKHISECVPLIQRLYGTARNTSKIRRKSN